MPDYEAIDLRFSADGDIVVNEGGDVTDTTVYPLLSLKQEIITRVLSNTEDWEIHPWMGANASSYIGEPLDEETMEALLLSIRSGLTVDGLVDDRDLELLWAQWDENTAAVVISVDVGQLDPDGEGRLEIPFTFSFEDLGVLIYDK